MLLNSSAFIAAILATSATLTSAAAIPSSLQKKDLSSFYSGLYVAVCGTPSAGESAVVYLGNGVAPYSLNAVNSTTSELISNIDTNITDNCYLWYTDIVGPHKPFLLQVVDSAGTIANTSVTLGDHPGRA